MKILQTGPNYVYTETTGSQGTFKIVYSYNSPVFIRGVDGQFTYICKYSKTSSRHISKCTGRTVDYWIKKGGAAEHTLDHMKQIAERL